MATPPKVIASRIDRDKDAAEGLRCPKCGSSSACLTRFTTFEVPLDVAPMVNFDKLTAELLRQLADNVTLLQQAMRLVETAREVNAIGDQLR